MMCSSAALVSTENRTAVDTRYTFAAPYHHIVDNENNTRAAKLESSGHLRACVQDQTKSSVCLYVIATQIVSTGVPAMASGLESRPAGPGLPTAVLAESDPVGGGGETAASAATAAPAASGPFEESWSLSNQ